MKLIADRQSLCNAVQHVGSIITSSLSRPMLKNVKLEAKEDAVYISATDLEVGICILVENVQVEEPGTILLLEDRVFPILRTTPDEKITLYGDESAINIESKDGKVRVLSEDPESFPVIEKMEKESFEIDPEVFDFMVSRTEFATAPEKGRYALNGILLKLNEEGWLDMVGADGARLANVIQKVVNEEKNELDCIVSKKGIHEASRLAGLCEDPLKISVSENKFKAGNSKGWMSCQLIEGQFPNYKEVIPSNCKNKIEVETGLLLSAIRRASLMASERSRAVDFNISGSEINISAQSADLGEANIKIAVSYDGNDEKITFNPDYLVDMLQMVKREGIKLEFNERNNPCVFSSGRDYTYVVSPVVKEEEENI